MAVLADIKMPDIEIPDVTKMELPKLELGKARDVALDNVSRARSSVQGAVGDRFQRNQGPNASPWVFIIAGLFAGMTIGYFLATSNWFGPRVKDAMGQARSRIDQMRAGSHEDDLGPVVTEYEMTAVMSEPAGTEPGTTDPLATGSQSEQSYAI